MLRHGHGISPTGQLGELKLAPVDESQKNHLSVENENFPTSSNCMISCAVNAP